jgi:hypothetical protein
MELRPRSVRVRLSPQEQAFVEKVQEIIGVPTKSEAIRFLIQQAKWMVDTKFLALPSPEVYERMVRSGAIKK